MGHRLCDLRDGLRQEMGVISEPPVAAVSWVPGGWDGQRTGVSMSTSHMLQAYPKVPTQFTASKLEASGPSQLQRQRWESCWALLSWMQSNEGSG